MCGASLPETVTGTYLHDLLIERTGRHGLPNATQFSGIDLVTMLPAPITEFLPMVTPGSIITPPPIHTLSSILTGSAKVRK